MIQVEGNSLARNNASIFWTVMMACSVDLPGPFTNIQSTGQQDSSAGHLSVTPRTHMVGGESQFPQAALISILVPVPTPTHTHKNT